MNRDMRTRGHVLDGSRRRRAAIGIALGLLILAPYSTAATNSPPRSDTVTSASVSDPSAPSTAPPLPGGRSCGKMSSRYGGIYASAISVRRITCRVAKRVLGRKGIYQAAPRGWRCKTVGDVYEGSTQRCTKSRSAMQFNAGV